MINYDLGLGRIVNQLGTALKSNIVKDLGRGIGAIALGTAAIYLLWNEHRAPFPDQITLEGGFSNGALVADIREDNRWAKDTHYLAIFPPGSKLDRKEEFELESPLECEYGPHKVNVSFLGSVSR